MMCRDHLVDYMQVRYGEPYQAAYLSDSVCQLPLAVAQGLGEWDISGLPQALREYPPTVTAAAWLAQACCLDPVPAFVFVPYVPYVQHLLSWLGQVYRQCGCKDAYSCTCVCC